MHTTLTLHSIARDFNDDPGNKCVLIDIPVPENTSLRDGASIVLTVSVAGWPTTLRIPAAGHIHSGTCNQQKGGQRGCIERCLRRRHYCTQSRAGCRGLQRGGR